MMLLELPLPIIGVGCGWNLSLRTNILPEGLTVVLTCLSVFEKLPYTNAGSISKGTVASVISRCLGCN